MKRRIEFCEGAVVLGPIRGVMDNDKNPSLPYAAAVGAVPLDLKGELYQVRRPLRVRLIPHAPYAYKRRSPASSSRGLGTAHLTSAKHA